MQTLTNIYGREKSGLHATRFIQTHSSFCWLLQMYIGRAKVSLKNIIEQTSDYLTLPLISDISDPESPQPQLIVNIYPVDSKGLLQALSGQTLDFH